MAELKFGRNVFDITDKDVVMFNGACWQLITQKIHNGWNDYSPRVSKAICEKFVKKGILVIYRKEQEYVTQDGMWDEDYVLCKYCPNCGAKMDGKEE